MDNAVTQVMESFFFFFAVLNRAEASFQVISWGKT